MHKLNTKTHTDIKHDGVIARHLPPFLLPYWTLARMDRPIGTWLLLLPALWSIAISTGGITNLNKHDIHIIILFCIGAILMRSAGCVINDLWDRNLDQKVERTQDRPLASGALSMEQAILFLLLLLLISLIILLQMNLITVLLGILSLPLIIAYPFMKRITWWPQAFLGVVFNFGALMGWSAINGILELPTLLLFASGFLWTMAYDTIYAHQDKEDDIMIGIKSSALALGKNSKKWVTQFYLGSWILLCGGTFTAYSSWHTLIALIPALSYALWLLMKWNPDDQESTLRTFKASRNYGLLVLIGLALAAIQIA